MSFTTSELIEGLTESFPYNQIHLFNPSDPKYTNITQKSNKGLQELANLSGPEGLYTMVFRNENPLFPVIIRDITSKEWQGCLGLIICYSILKICISSFDRVDNYCS